MIEDNNVHKLYPPGDDKWDSNVVYIVTYPKGELNNTSHNLLY